MADIIKFVLALVLLLAGIVGFNYLSEQAMIFRILVMLLGVGCSATLAWYTNLGRQFFGFARDSVNEAKKVVWPTGKETLQTTGLVFVFVILMASFLWLADISIAWVVSDWILGWGK